MSGLFDIAQPRNFVHGHPHEFYDAICSEAGIARAPSIEARPPYALLTRHKDIRSVSLDRENFSSTGGFRILEANGMSKLDPEIAAALHKNMLLLDPPEHGQVRLPLQSDFAPPSLKALRQKLGDMVDQLVSGLTGRTEVEFVTDIASGRSH